MVRAHGAMSLSAAPRLGGKMPRDPISVTQRERDIQAAGESSRDVKGGAGRRGRSCRRSRTLDVHPTPELREELMKRAELEPGDGYARSIGDTKVDAGGDPAAVKKPRNSYIRACYPSISSPIKSGAHDCGNANAG